MREAQNEHRIESSFHFDVLCCRSENELDGMFYQNVIEDFIKP